MSAVELDRFELPHARGVTRHVYGPGAIAAGAAQMEGHLAARSLFLFAVRPVLELHAGELEAVRQRAGRFEVVEIPDGEAAKTIAVAESVWRRLLTAGGLRDSLVAAFGGGSVSDLAGFVAGAFLRGVDWIGIPTTLLAQVDAAVGGKTGVDLPEAKNAVGLFHHPLAVWAEPALLRTLPGEQVRSGLVEVIKVGAILDPGLFDTVERELDALRSADPARLAPVVASAARAKAALVASDPDEQGPRKLLNFGHTLGHALEAEIGYGEIAHGDAVAHGLRFALELSDGRGDDAFAARLRTLLDRLGVPPLPELDAGRLLERIARDKKARHDGVDWILLAGAGRGEVERLPPEEVERRLLDFLRRARRATV